MTQKWPADRVERRPIDGLVPAARNARTHSEAQVAQIAASMREWGWTNPVLVDEAGGIIAGHGRVLAARSLGFAEVPVMVAEGWSEAQKRAYLIADNQLGLNAGWDEALLAGEVKGLAEWGFDVSLLGFADLDAVMAERRPVGLTDPDEAPEPPERPTATSGDLWALGRHRLLCGDSTQPADVSRLIGGHSIDAILTDPPYCSGGFQESGKASGSIGSDGAKHKKGGTFQDGIANDRLSTRGYLALMKSVIGLTNARLLYAFTDWRMWINLYDVAESSGYAVRNMVVWDKGTPGMGRGWRTQHELVLFGAKATVNFDNHKAQGNVITSKRTGNLLHPTQKPTDLLCAILAVTDMAKAVYDPFTGSGSTLIACEQESRTFYGNELSPPFVDVCIKRWQDFTGEAATLDGRTFDEVAAERAKAAA